MVEEWKPINGFTRYAISNLGRVRGVWGRIASPQIGRWGHRRVSLWRDGATLGKSRSVHSLVLEHFVGPAPDGHVASHKDGNAANNCVDNLAWETPSENERRKIAHGTSNRGERHGMSKLNKASVREIKVLLKRGESRHGIASRYGVTVPCIGLIARGQRWAWLEEEDDGDPNERILSEVPVLA